LGPSGTPALGCQGWTAPLVSATVFGSPATV
jgi:hypothetical protein